MVYTDTEEFDSSYCDSNENRARVVQELKASGYPIDGWVCVGWDDWGNDSHKCQLCGIERVRYVHHMKNTMTGDELYVGCYCAGGMENDLDAAIERTKYNQNRLKRRKRFMDRGWLEQDVGSRKIYKLTYKRFRLMIMRSEKGWYGYRINYDDWVWNYCRSFDKAKEMIFDYIDQLTRSS